MKYEKGYIGPFTIMPPEEMAAVKEYLIRMASTESGIYSYKRGDFVVDGADEEQRNSNSKVMSNFEVALRKMQWRDRHLEDATLLGLFKHPAVTERCAQLLGPDLMLWRTQFFPCSKKNQPQQPLQWWVRLEQLLGGFPPSKGCHLC